jgi:hypothetical protein
MFHAMKAVTVIGVLALLALGFALSPDDVAARSATLG